MSNTTELTHPEKLSMSEAFWRLKLRGLAGPTPASLSPAGRRETRGDGNASAEVRLDAGVVQNVRLTAQGADLPLVAFVLGAWALLIACHSAEGDLIFGVKEHACPILNADDLIPEPFAVTPLRVHVPANEPILPWLGNLWHQYAEAREHSDIPPTTIRQWAGLPPNVPLFETAVVVSTDAVGSTMEPWERDQVRHALGQVGCTLILLEDLRSAESLTILYDRRRIEAHEAIELLNSMAVLLRAMSTDPSRELGSVPLLTEEASRRVLVEWNRNKVEYPRTQCIHHLIEEQTERTPDAIAVVFRDELMSYSELGDRSNRVARHLQELGVGPETLVGIATERSVEMVIGLLATLKAGGAYVPLDPSYPQERIAFMIEDAQPGVILTQRHLLPNLPLHPGHTLCLDRDTTAARHAGHRPACPGVESENLAYVIYTSGSTGKPKGVMITHHNVVNFFAGMDRVIGSQHPGVWLAVTSISFDISVLELLWTLSRGFKVVIQEDRQPPDLRGTYSIPAQLRKHHVSHLQCTPSMARMLSNDQASLEALGSLRQLLLGGEPLSASLVKTLRQSVHGEIYNMYGPTETTIWSTAHLVDQIGETISIGQPMANTEAYILDRMRRPVPVGIPGELWIGGEGVARGYLRRPELTAERFVSNPFNKLPGARIYKTGDLVRYGENRNLEFIGRTDNQLKIRGFRVELGEIEAVLEQHPGIQNAVVVSRESTSGDRQLVAYVVSRPGSLTSPEQWRAYLQQRLPGYMVPSRFVPLQSLPLTPNKKINRDALPAPEQIEHDSNTPGTMPNLDLERRIAGIWREALGLDHVGRNDNFFDLGAHSLLIVEVNTRLGEMLQTDLPLTTMFQYPTVSSLATFLGDMASPPPSQAHGSGSERGQARRASMLRRALRE